MNVREGEREGREVVESRLMISGMVAVKETRMELMACSKP
jgi:hypothetical protein